MRELTDEEHFAQISAAFNGQSLPDEAAARIRQLEGAGQPPALGAVAMREAAAKVAWCAFDDRPRRDNMHWNDGFHDGTKAASAAIRSIPLPSDADLDAAALARPKVAALVALLEQAQKIIDPCSPPRSLEWQVATRNAIAALESSHE